MDELTSEMQDELVKRVINEIKQQGVQVSPKNDVCIYIVLQEMDVYTRTDLKILGTDKYHYSHQHINRFMKAFDNKEDAIMYALRQKDCFIEEITF